MFNVGGPEVMVILLVALMILGPKELPKAVRAVGNVMAELRRMSSGFQEEIRSALDVPIEAEAREKGAQLARTPEEADITETVARNTDPVEADLGAVYFADGSAVPAAPAQATPVAPEAGPPAPTPLAQTTEERSIEDPSTEGPSGRAAG